MSGIFILDDHDQKKIEEAVDNFAQFKGIEINLFPFIWDRVKSVQDNIEQAKSSFQQKKTQINLIILDHYFEEPEGGRLKDCLTLGLLDYFKVSGTRVVVLTGARDQDVFPEVKIQGADRVIQKNVKDVLSLKDLENIFSLLDLNVQGE